MCFTLRPITQHCNKSTTLYFKVWLLQKISINKPLFSPIFKFCKLNFPNWRCFIVCDFCIFHIVQINVSNYFLFANLTFKLFFCKSIRIFFFQQFMNRCSEDRPYPVINCVGQFFPMSFFKNYLLCAFKQGGRRYFAFFVVFFNTTSIYQTLR